MPIPVFGESFDDPAFMSPDDRLATRFQAAGDRPELPDSIVLALQDYLLDEAAERPEATEITFGTDLYDGYGLPHDGTEIGVVGNYGIGGPTRYRRRRVDRPRCHPAPHRRGCGTLQETVTPGDDYRPGRDSLGDGDDRRVLPRYHRGDRSLPRGGRPDRRDGGSLPVPIARYREVSGGTILAPFDRLTGEEWTWAGKDIEPRDRLVDIFDIGLEALFRTG